MHFHRLTRVLLCILFIFVTAKDVNLAVACNGFFLLKKLSIFFTVATLITMMLFEQVFDLYCCVMG